MIDLTKPWPLGLDSRRWPLFCLAVVLGVALLAQIDIWASQSTIAWPDLWRAPFFFITDYGLSDWVLIPSLAIFILALVAGRLLKDLPGLAAREVATLSGFVFLGVGVPGLMANLIKRLIGRGRPTEYDVSGAFSFQNVINDWSFQSFPSGHTTTAIALAFVIGFLWPRLFLLFLAIGIVVSFSRVPIGMHYPSDVFGGLVVGMLGAYLVRNIFARRGWLFETLPDGRIVARPFSAIPRLFQRASE
ncbi:MAG: phosphatase PAP2 family protein [Alphaproteobacteria bacterium]|nr:phosphatase PAP2 family protein [Alphaproteobacteria bacterium]MBU1561861.1 phosphatase PAP2 family protein [Alphaproteobacteria bacterium]MBU2304541.1 phosphatase PAP2 family protein [Alphaproteobacteria bacterium]MBU2367772.1 phosphatase PAP2 family protein [Alphaproteobacteria bacterium]